MKGRWHHLWAVNPARARPRTVAMNAAIVATAYAAGRLLGMVREVALAARFGTGEAYDAYVAAFRIPDLLFAVVMSGAFGAAFIPVFGGYLARDDAKRAWRLANALLTWTVVITVVAAGAMFVFAEPIVTRVIAPEMSPSGQELAVELTRILLVSPLLLGIGAAAKGMLEAQDLFTLPAIAPIVYNLGIIFGAVALAPGMGIHGLAVGVVLGAAGHVGIQLGWLLRHGLRLRPTLDPATEGLRDVMRLAGPRLLGQLVAQSNLVVVTNAASRAGEGAISALSYGQHLILLPHGILAMSLSTVIFPRMARQFALGQIRELRQTLLGAIGPLTFLTVPAIIVLVALRESIVQVAFQYGSFTAESTTLVTDSLLWLAPGLLARSLIEPLTRAFYALHDTRTPLLVATGTVALNAVLAFAWVDDHGIIGISASLSIAYTLRMAVLMLVLSRRTGGVTAAWLRGLRSLLLPTLVLSLLAIAFAGPLAAVTDPAGGRHLWGYVALTLALFLLGLTYLAAARVARVPEAVLVTDRLARWLPRR